MTQVHANARTTPKTREEIHHCGLPIKEIMARYSISKATARKWRERDDFEDRSHRPEKLATTLTPAQEVLVTTLRTMLLLPLDDLLAITKQYVNAKASRSALDRLLQREGIGNLKALIAAQTPEGEKPEKKGFKDYEPGYFHMDIKYLPQMPDETSRSYLFVAIDRATRWVFMRIYSNQTEASSVDFLSRLEQASPVKIEKLLTDNGSQFTDRFTSKAKTPSGEHAFDRRCAALGIEHRLIPPRTPQMNGMVERFNGRISEVLQQTRFVGAADLAATLQNYLKLYNHHIPQRALGHVAPVDALKEWQKKKPELFRKRIYKQTGLDS